MTEKNGQPRDITGKYETQTGGAKAIKQLQHGDSLSGIAAEAQAAVEMTLETEGIHAIMRLNATRTQAVADMYWGALQKAAQDGDLEQLDKFTARYGWLSGVAMRAWQAVNDLEKKSRRTTILNVMKGGGNE